MLPETHGVPVYPALIFWLKRLKENPGRLHDHNDPEEVQPARLHAQGVVRL